MDLLIRFICLSFSETGTSAGPDLNFPLPGETGTPCLVKVCYLSTGLLIDQDKHIESKINNIFLSFRLNMFWVLRRTISLRWFF